MNQTPWTVITMDTNHIIHVVRFALQVLIVIHVVLCSTQQTIEFVAVFE